MTATVECIPLIVASILSKKLAEGIDALVFDVKVGRGAFMSERADARALAEGLIAVVAAHGQARDRAASPTWTSRSAARSATRSRSRESIEVLRGGGPADVRELTLALGAEMLVLAGVVARCRPPRARCAEAALADGAALEMFRQVVEGAGRRRRRVGRSFAPRARGACRGRAAPRAAGFVAAIDAYALGELIVHLGGGPRSQGG